MSISCIFFINILILDLFGFIFLLRGYFFSFKSLSIMKMSDFGYTEILLVFSLVLFSFSFVFLFAFSFVLFGLGYFISFLLLFTFETSIPNSRLILFLSLEMDLESFFIALFLVIIFFGYLNLFILNYNKF